MPYFRTRCPSDIFVSTQYARHIHRLWHSKLEWNGIAKFAGLENDGLQVVNLHGTWLRHVAKGGALAPPENVVNCFCALVTSKMLSKVWVHVNEILMHYLQNTSSASGASPWSLLRNSVRRPLNLSTPGKNSAGSHEAKPTFRRFSSVESTHCVYWPTRH